MPAGADTITIGRASNADIRLQADDQISRIHARLTRDGATWTLHDESRNGTGLNGQRLTGPTPLSTGDRIHIGRSVITFHKSTIPSPDAATTVPSAPPTTPAAPPTTPAAPPSTPAPPAPPTAFPAAPDVQQHPADPVPTPQAHRDQPPAEAAFPTDRGADEQFSTARAFPDDPVPAPHTPPHQSSPAAPAYPEALSTPDDPAPAGTSPFAPDDREPVGRSPFTPDDRAPAGTNPFAPDEPAPAGAPPFAVDDRGPDGANPFAPTGQDLDRNDEYDVAGVVPGFDLGDGAARSGDAGAWAAYPSADNPEPVRSPWEISAQIDQSEPNWNASDSWPDPSVATADRRTAAAAAADQRTPAEHRATTDRRSPATDRRTAGSARLPSTADPDDTDAVGSVRLARVLIAAGGVIVLGLIVNLIVTFLSDGPGNALRWLVPPAIALIVAMVLAVTDAAAPKPHRPGRLNVSVLVAIAVVLVGVGVGGFALTAGTEYVAGYLTGNESGEDRLIKPVAKSTNGITLTVENVTYTGHFTRIEVAVANAAKQAVTIPLDGTTFTAADGTALRADTGKSSWPSRIASGGTEHGTITFKGHLPDSATTAVLTFKSGDTTFPVPGVTLSQ
nr:FHA domain-containing protein [Kribbella shirazensis]